MQQKGFSKLCTSDSASTHSTESSILDASVYGGV